MKVFYHADLDGECAAAVVLHRMMMSSEPRPVSCIPIDYKDDFPFDRVQPGEEVWIVDFSLQRAGDWRRLLHDVTPNVTWIDHHKTAIEASDDDPEVRELAGLRHCYKGAGCLLTWQYAMPGHPLPLGVDLVSDYDTWQFDDDRTRPWQAYLSAAADTRPESSFWIPIMQRSWAGYDDAFDIGERIITKRAIDAEKDVRSWAFDVDFEGLRGIALNRRGINSAYFDSVASDYDLLLPFAFDGRRWTVSVYRGGRQPDLDCSEIAKRYGGGGHPGASGFQCAELPWRAE